jgi:hypothetical protein
MDPVLVVSAIRAAVRLGNVGAEAVGQYARDRGVLLPAVIAISVPEVVRLRAHFETYPEQVTEDLIEYWKSFKDPRSTPLPGARDVLSAAYARWSIEQTQGGAGNIDDATGYWMIKQWGNGGPIGPFAKVVLAMADVALEFAARDPSLLGLQGRGEAVVKALAGQIAELIPDDLDELGPRNQLGATLAGLFLRGALQALESNPNLVVDEKHMMQLVKDTLPQLINALPSADGPDQYRWRDLVESLMGPVAKAVIEVLGQHPESFFGKKFSDNKLLGALTRTYLLKVAEDGVKKTLTKAGAIELWKATLALAAKQPDLFLGEPEKNAEKFVSSLFVGLATTLERYTPPFEKEIVTHLAATALGTMSKNIGLLLDRDAPWNEVATNALATVLGALRDALTEKGRSALDRLVSSDMLTEFVRIVLSQAARTPGMLMDTDNEELKRIVGAVARLMALDDSLLLSKDDWLFIAAAVAEEAAANPARLFGFKVGESKTDVAVPLIQGLVTVAAVQWRQYGRAGGAVLFGTTLREAIVIVVRAASGNAKAALGNKANLEQLADRIGVVVVQNPGKFGSKEWLRLYRVLIPRVLETGSVGELDAPALEAILKGANP